MLSYAMSTQWFITRGDELRCIVLYGCLMSLERHLLELGLGTDSKYEMLQS